MAAYAARWPIGTGQCVWLYVLAYLALRRGDAVRVGRQHVRNVVVTRKTDSGFIEEVVRCMTMKTEKSRFTVEVNVPILPVLQAPDLVAISPHCWREGSPPRQAELRQCVQSHLQGGWCSGLRPRPSQDRGDPPSRQRTEFELMAIFGWTDAKTASHYVKTANRKRLAAQAMAKLNADGTSIPAPLHPVRAAKGKSE
jgi:hypothetical protein